MQLSNIPDKLVLPWATSGNKNNIPVASQIGITAGAASLTDGFPPLTMTPVAAGGVPPSGLDMNGILYEMSTILRWANAGGGYAYDSTFANDSHVGGYPKGARVMRSDGTGYWFNTVDNNTTDPEAAGAAAAGWVPDYQAGAATVAMSGSSVTLSPVQYGKPLIVITGALSANLNLIFPAIAEGWTVINNTTGGYIITAKTASGSGVALGTVSQIVGDGTNIYSSNPDSVKIITNVATLRNIQPTLPLRVQTRGYYTDGDGGAGQYFAKVGAAPGTYVDDGGAVIVPNGGNGSTAWLLDISNGLDIRQFGAKGDGVTDDTAAIQAAINATPTGGILRIGSDGAYLIDTLPSVKVASDLGVNWLYGGLIINKSLRFIGNKSATIKVKDFSSAWAAQANGDTITAIIINASNVHIDGVNVDANKPKHYETSGGYKYWETGPTLKRPPCGITVISAPGQANVTNVLIENCRIINPLAGIYFFGNALDSLRASFLNGSLTTGVVKDCISRNNQIENAQGNGVIFNIGCDNCVSDSDHFINGMYHAVRMYSRAINCKAVNGRSHINCDQILARYNPTDNGYFRTDNPADANFKIFRQGFHIGGVDSYSGTYGYSVINCGFQDCEHIFTLPTALNYADYFTPSSLYMAAFSSTGLKNSYIKQCRSYGADYGVVLYSDGIAPADAIGINVSGNSISASNINDILIQGIKNAVVSNNTVNINPSITYTSAYLVGAVNGTFAGNAFKGIPQSATYAVIISGDATNLAVKNNQFDASFISVRRYAQEAGSTPICMFPGRVNDLVNSAVIGGSSLSNGWAVAYGTPLEGQENNIRAKPDGSLKVCLRLSGAAATASTVATLVSHLRPVTTIGFVATDLSNGLAYWGRILTDGRIQITLPAYPSVALTQLWAEIDLTQLL